jgi:hypothetical protein
MSTKPNKALRLTLAVGIAVISLCVAKAQTSPGAQNASLQQTAAPMPLADFLKTQYKPAKVGSDSRITEAGTVLVIQADGILGVPPGKVAVCPTIYKDGAMQAPSAVAKAQCGNDVRKLNSREKVYPLKIEVDSKRDRVSLVIVECGSCDGTPSPASYESQVVFQFSNGFLEAADAGQVEDVISQVLTIDTGTIDPPSQPKGGPGSSSGLTNEDIIKLVKEFPDSVIIAKIKSSNCNFDTSTEALIKLKRAGASGPVLQAIVEAPTSVSSAPPTPPTPDPTPPIPPSQPPDCPDYDSCFKSGAAFLEGGLPAKALARFQEATQFDPARGDAWAGIATADLQLGQYDDVANLWDKALQLGSTLAMDVCHAGAICGDTGTFFLSTKEVSFVNKKGEKVFSAAPSAVTSEGAVLYGGASPAYYLQIHFEKNWRFYYTPKSIHCSMNFACPEPGQTQQKVFADYVHEVLVRIAAGEFGSRPTKP